MNVARPFHLFAILYRQSRNIWQAQVLAETQDQAIQVLWEGLAEGKGPLFHDVTQELITVETIEDKGLASKIAPYPEALPTYPKVMVLLRLEES